MNLEQFFIPYTAQASLPGKTIAVLAPHPDDEVFGCGGALHQLSLQGASIYVAIISSGAAHNSSDETHAATRKLESQRAAKIIGYPAPEFWDLDDGTLFDETQLQARVQHWLQEIGPDLILAPSTWEMHRDHRAVAVAALQAMRSCDDETQIALYEVGVPLQPNLLVDISAAENVKAEAMQCFASQQALQHYREQIQGLNVYRSYTLPLTVSSAEAYVLLDKAQAARVLTDEAPEQHTFVLRAAAMQLEKEALLRTKFEQKSFELGQDKAKLLDQLDLSLHQKSALTAQLGTALENARVQLNVAAQDASEKQQKIAELQDALADSQSLVADSRRDFENVMNSTSWRITAPVRLCRLLLKSPKSVLTKVGPLTLRKLWRVLPLPAGVKNVARSLPQRLRNGFERLSYSDNNLKAAQHLLERRVITTERAGLAPQSLVSVPLDFSVVTYNSSELLSAFMQSLTQQSYPTALISLTFVDNDSTDNTRAVIATLQQEYRDQFSAIELLEQPNNGFGAGHNAGINNGSAAFVLVVNPDIEFTADTLTQLVADAQQSPATVACWEARQKPYEHPKLYDPISRELNWCSHACVLLRRSAMETINGYDERIFLYAEDVEVSYRLREAGFTLKYVPKSVVWHYTYESAGEVKPAQYVGSLIGNFYLRTRYGTAKDRLFILPMMLSLLSLSPFKGARKALIKDFFTRYLRHVPALLHERSNTTEQSFSFRLLDYEKQREGAFWPGKDLVDVPLVSIITRTVANRGELLKQAGCSVFNQTYPNIEWVVVEDGGEQQRPYVEHFQSSDQVKIRYEPLPKVGRSAAGNRGMEIASGDWLMFLDDDDCLYADHVETLMLEIQAQPNVSAAYSLAWEVESKVEQGGRHIEEASYHQVPSLKQAYDNQLLRHSNYIPIQAILFSAQLFKVRGGFDTTLDYLEDWHLWQRYAHDNTFAYVPKTTSMYRTPMDQTQRKQRQLLLDGAYKDVKARAQEDIQKLMKIQQPCDIREQA